MSGVRAGQSDAQAPPHDAHVHRMDPVERTIRAILLVGIAVSVALMAVGLVLGAARGAVLPRAMVTLSALPAALARLDPAAYVSLGLMVLVATPFVRVVGSLVAFVVERDRAYVLITATVLAVMCLGVLLGRA